MASSIKALIIISASPSARVRPAGQRMFSQPGMQSQRSHGLFHPRRMQAWTNPGRPPVLPPLRPIRTPSSLHRASLAAPIGVLSIQAILAFPGGSARQFCASAAVENAAVAINARNSGFIFLRPRGRTWPSAHASTLSPWWRIVFKQIRRSLRLSPSSFPNLPSLPSAHDRPQHSRFGETPNRQIRAPPGRLRLSSTSADIPSLRKRPSFSLRLQLRGFGLIICFSPSA